MDSSGFIETVPQTVAVEARPPNAGGTNELANLDLLRSVAVGLVFFNHLGLFIGIHGVTPFGHFGVLLFFVHTALVLCMSMERLRLAGTRLYSVFMIRRVFRIYPLSILAVIVVTVFALPADSRVSNYVAPDWGTLVSNFALVQNVTQSPTIYSVLWSLPYEVQMYALLPLLFFWLNRVRSVRAAMAGWVVALGLAVGECLLRNPSENTNAGLLTRYFPCFMGGLIAWQAIKRWPRRLPGWLWPICLLGFVIASMLAWLAQRFGPGSLLHWSRWGGPRQPAEWPVWVNIAFEAALCALVGMMIPRFREIRSRWLKHVVSWIARYSYGIYLSHFAVVWLCFGRWSAGGRVIDSIDVFLLTAAISVFAYHLIEDPFIRLGKRLSADR